MSSASDDAPSTSHPSNGWIGHLLRALHRSPRFRLVRRIVHRHAQFGPPVFFFGGVTWDALTLQRIDSWIVNWLLLTYLILLGGCVLYAIRYEYDDIIHPRLRALGRWYPPAIQFLTGALFSALVVFYMQSATLGTSLFLVVLVGVLVANEFIWSRAFNVYVLLGVYFLAALAFFVLVLPVILGWMGYGMFLLSSAASVALVGGMLVYLDHRGLTPHWQTRAGLASVVITLVLTVHLCYVQNWMPPVPLALRDGGVAHDVRVENGAYHLTYEPAPRHQFWRRESREVHHVPGDTLYAFAAVFAPTTIETEIAHRWQRYDEAAGEWVTTDRIPYPVTGGRLTGYRGYTMKRNVAPGQWRVRVETAREAVIGQFDFQVVEAASDERPQLRERAYE